MIVFWIVAAVAVYALLLGMVLAFFASVRKADDRWKHLSRRAHQRPPRRRDHIRAA